MLELNSDSHQTNVVRPKVSVCIVSYNHEKFIGQCLQSLVDQVVDFDFEIIIGDDASKDSTREIIESYAVKYPALIKPIFHSKNKGPVGNYLSVHNMARGEYVAHVDGDDFALPGKLAALASHLDGNPDCAIVWHRLKILNEHGQFAIGMPLTPVSSILGKTKLYARDLALYYGLTGCHSGSMYRRSNKRIESVAEELIDYYLTLSMLKDGFCAMYIDEPYGVYRFFSTENTLTRAKGSVITGRLKLTLMRDYLKTNPEFRQAFSAQCVFEIVLRLYLRYPLVKDYFLMWFKCGVFFKPSDFLIICKVFKNNRNSKLRQAMAENPVFIA
jgi:glycosyltransferase involved in cell wall biosynthesis